MKPANGAKLISAATAEYEPNETSPSIPSFAVRSPGSGIGTDRVALLTFTMAERGRFGPYNHALSAVRSRLGCRRPCGGGALGFIALSRGETISAAWLLVAAVCSYLVAYRFYSRFIADSVFGLDACRATPAERLSNGRDFVPTSKWVLFGHHFSAISGAGPLVGPTLAAQFGFLPGTLWLIAGVVLGGAVQDFLILCASVRRDGKSLGQIAKEEVNPVAGLAAMVAIFAIMIILLAVLALVVVNALRDSPWGLFTIACTIPDRPAHGSLDELHPAGEGR